MTEEKRKELIRAQQGELDGVETYLMLADTVNNDADKEAFRKLAADEGRHASVFKRYTGEILRPRKLQARAVVMLYNLIGKKALYPLIAKTEYAAIPGYEQLEKEFPEVESVKKDEERHGDTLNALLDNGEYADKAKWPLVVCIIALIALALQIERRK